MATVSQMPITEEVCVKTERRIVGWRAITDDEAAVEESFSNGIPGLAGPTWNRADYMPPPGVIFPGGHGWPGGGDPESPGSTFVPPTDGGGAPDFPEVPLPGAAWLFIGAALVAYALRTIRRTAADIRK